MLGDDAAFQTQLTELPTTFKGYRRDKMVTKRLWNAVYKKELLDQFGSKVDANVLHTFQSEGEKHCYLLTVAQVEKRVKKREGTMYLVSLLFALTDCMTIQLGVAPTGNSEEERELYVSRLNLQAWKTVAAGDEVKQLQDYESKKLKHHVS